MGRNTEKLENYVIPSFGITFDDTKLTTWLHWHTPCVYERCNSTLKFDINLTGPF
jgi:hypothetical protein